MFKIYCVTDRKLCNEDFLTRIEKIAKARPSGIILREKDLTEEEYMKLSQDVLEICKKHRTPCILHSYFRVAKQLKCKSVHLPHNILYTLYDVEKRKFSKLGTSCHSVEDAIIAEKFGCTYIVAGHIYETDCKKNIQARGTDFLRNVCDNVSVPVYAIGGITVDKIKEVKECGAEGVCVMSGAMMCDDVEKYFGELKNEAKK